MTWFRTPVADWWAADTTKLLKEIPTEEEAEGPRDAPQIRNIALENACNRGMIFKDTQGHYSCCY